MKRWVLYQRERFPLAGHAPLVAAFSASAMCYSSLVRHHIAIPSPAALFVAFATSLLFFLQLRIADEFKDHEDDARFRPYRAVPRGLVTLRELAWVGIAAAVAQLGLALWLDADRMGKLLPVMDQKKLDLQREVVKNERRQRVDNAPYGKSNETIIAALYPANHPYHWPVIGSMADLSAASLDDVKQFFRTYYAPNNATMVIAGDYERPKPVKPPKATKSPKQVASTTPKARAAEHCRMKILSICF